MLSEYAFAVSDFIAAHNEMHTQMKLMSINLHIHKHIQQYSIQNPYNKIARAWNICIHSAHYEHKIQTRSTARYFQHTSILFIYFYSHLCNSLIQYILVVNDPICDLTAKNACNESPSHQHHTAQVAQHLSSSIIYNCEAAAKHLISSPRNPMCRKYICSVKRKTQHKLYLHFRHASHTIPKASMRVRGNTIRNSPPSSDVFMLKSVMEALRHDHKT